MNKYLCPVCGYGMENEPANYNICPSCGTEFGLHDQNASIEELRAAWIKSGLKWWSKTDIQPTDWNPLEQLEKVTAPVRVIQKVRVVISQVSEHNVSVQSGNATNSLPIQTYPVPQTNWGNVVKIGELELSRT